MNAMQLDCRTCPVRGLHCDSCMVTALLALSPSPAAGEVCDPYEAPLDGEERRALSVLADAGLVAREEVEDAAAWCEPLRSSG